VDPTLLTTIPDNKCLLSITAPDNSDVILGFNSGNDGYVEINDYLRAYIYDFGP
jgi:hypothetical protein